MVKPLLDYFGADKILTASMVTVHAATGSQEVLDRLPDAKTKDLRKNRSILNNIILTSTGAAKALSLVIPEMKRIGFIAESVRIPTSTGSLIVLVVTLEDESLQQPIKRELVNQIFQTAPKVLMEHGKAKNPWPNVDAQSGVIQWFYGVKEYSFYTVLFGIGRAIGTLANITWDRALGYALERPKSLTTAMLEEYAEKGHSDKLADD